MRRILFTAFLLTFAATNILAQDTALILENGVDPHLQIDAVYKTFSDGYRTLRPEMVADLYSEDAAYLPPDNDILNGRRAILENFTSFFDSMKERGQTMTISFHIFQRKVEKTIGYDVGIYTINYYKDGEKLGEAKGKFVVVAVRGKDKKWRFQVDGYNGLKPQENN
ncbi:MAG: DUF4440 domain-containing protein [Acidobacteria bacterium]|nr:DUF4440 domain-containing protein [Acidobacteriota bacterium]